MNETKSFIVNSLVNDIGHKKDGWNDIFAGNLIRIGDWDDPIPDFAYMDNQSEKTIAFLFALSSKSIEYYINYIEKAIKLLGRHDYCILIIPEYVGLDSVGALLEKKLYERNLTTLPIGLVEYRILDENDFLSYRVTKQARNTEKHSIQKSKTEKKSYWCWWRDASHFEVFQLLELSEKYINEAGDIYSNKIYPKFFNLMIEGKTKQWDGRIRNKKYSESSYKSEKQNYKIPIMQLGLWTQSEGRITEKGRKLLSIGRYYGLDSIEYFNSLAKLILVDGNHLDLIREVIEFQKINSSIIPQTSTEYFLLLDSYLEDKDSIGTRKPSAVKSGAKKAYLRDEPKLWNKLGLVNTYGSGRYFKAFNGISFNWNKINEILLAEI